MPLIFLNVGWMNHYNGIDGDSIERGGKYNQHSIGHEVCNFSNNAGTLYGYVQPTGQIKIEKLGASKKDDFVSGVTVVWTAGPESGGTVVVGWYKDATVYRDAQTITNPSKLQKKNGITSYRIKAPADKAVLLPVEQRELIIPRAVKGGIGQSNVWFADKDESQKIVDRVIALIVAGILTSPSLPADMAVRLCERFVNEYEAVVKMVSNVGGFSNPIKKAIFNAGFHTMFRREYDDLKPKIDNIWEAARLEQADPIGYFAYITLKRIENAAGHPMETDEYIEAANVAIEQVVERVHTVLSGA